MFYTIVQLQIMTEKNKIAKIWNTKEIQNSARELIQTQGMLEVPSALLGNVKEK